MYNARRVARFQRIDVSVYSRVSAYRRTQGFGVRVPLQLNGVYGRIPEFWCNDVMAYLRRAGFQPNGVTAQTQLRT